MISVSYWKQNFIPPNEASGVLYAMVERHTFLSLPECDVEHYITGHNDFPVICEVHPATT